MVKKIKGVFQYDLKKDGKVHSWTVDLKVATVRQRRGMFPNVRTSDRMATVLFMKEQPRERLTASSRSPTRTLPRSPSRRPTPRASSCKASSSSSESSALRTWLTFALTCSCQGKHDAGYEDPGCEYSDAFPCTPCTRLHGRPLSCLFVFVRCA